MGRQFGKVYPIGVDTYKRVDPQVTALADNGSVAARIVLAVGGLVDARKPRAEWLYSRHPPSCTGMDGITLGMFHFARSNAQKLLRLTYEAQPQEWEAVIAREGYRRAASKAKNLGDAAWLRRNDPQRDDKGLYRFDWLRNSWPYIGRQLWCVDLQVKLWWGGVYQRARDAFDRNGWKTARGLAICCRAANSGGPLRLAREAKALYPDDELRAVDWMLDAYKSEKGDGRYHYRSQVIKQLFPDPEERAGDPRPEQLDWWAAYQQPAEALPSGGRPPVLYLTPEARKAAERVAGAGPLSPRTLRRSPIFIIPLLAMVYGVWTQRSKLKKLL